MIELTKVMTIGVPVGLYIDLEHDEIRELLLDKLNIYVGQKNTCVGLPDSPNEKIVNLPIRLDVKYIEIIKELAHCNKMGIIDFTSRLLIYK